MHGASPPSWSYDADAEAWRNRSTTASTESTSVRVRSVLTPPALSRGGAGRQAGPGPAPR
ncbi:hypothetical protein [Frankia tisae]|uniref:hypothetical protein n=1 Tax=Frankia tisae TaxID=2950104 RepID=UPI0021C1BDFF|nr:hypothetical protein [Frankia tisae]